MTDNENRNETLPEEESRGASPAGQSRAPAGAKRPVPKVLVGIVAVLAAVALFFGGFFTYKATLPEGVRSLLWFKEQIDSNYYQDVSDEDFWDAALHGAADVLDMYSAYYTAEEYDVEYNSMLGLMEGMGLSFFSSTNKIYRVAINSPAFFAETAEGEKGAVQAGMYLTGVGASADSIVDTLYTPVPVSGGVTYTTDNPVSAEISKYKAGDTVYLRLSSVEGNDTEHCVIVPVTLAAYTETYLLYAYNGRAWAFVDDGTGVAVWTDVSEYVSVDEKMADGTAYVRIVEFAGNAGSGFRQLAEQYKSDGAQRMLLDLRNNGGGDLGDLMLIAGYLLRDADSPTERLLTAVYKDGTRYNFAASGDYFADYFGDSEVYVAANGNTASASEALLGAMISYGTCSYEDVYLTDADGDGAAKTYGKGIMQQFYTDSSTGDVAKMTTAVLYWPNGTCIHDVGVTTSDGAKATQGASSNADYGDAELDYILSAIAA